MCVCSFLLHETVMTVDIYYQSGSPPCTYVRVVAKKVGVDVNLKTINLMAKEQLKPEFVEINPLHTVPTLNDNGFVLWESRAIAFYLVDTYAPDSPLYPKDTRKRAEVNKLVFFESATFYQAQMAFFVSTVCLLYYIGYFRVDIMSPKSDHAYHISCCKKHIYLSNGFRCAHFGESPVRQYRTVIHSTRFSFVHYYTECCVVA